MNEELKDRGLKKAVREQTTFRLPSNFTYRTKKPYVCARRNQKEEFCLQLLPLLSS